MEFAVDADLPIYSGGLGVLAGDHLKAAAELGVPLVGVGLFYRGGYFAQGLERRGPADRGLPGGRPRGRRPRARAGHRRSRPRGRDRHRRGVALGRRLGAALPARCRPAHRRALQRRPRAPDPPGAAARRRRRARARGARRSSRPSSTSTRATRRSSTIERARALVRGRARAERRARAGAALDRLHDPHAGARRQRGVRRGARPPLRRQPRRAGRASTATRCSRSGAPTGQTASG